MLFFCGTVYLLYLYFIFILYVRMKKSINSTVDLYINFSLFYKMKKTRFFLWTHQILLLTSIYFLIEQQEYVKERLEWTNLTWTDNTPVIHLLGKKPVGILHLLDDESNFPKASDSSFLEKCHYNHALNENYCRPRVGGREFGVSKLWYFEYILNVLIFWF